MTTKKVNGIDVAYNKSYYSFFQQKLEEDKQKKNISQTYFPVFIKRKLNDDFVVHTEYNGSCRYSNFTKKQYLPNRKNAEVVTDISVYYYESKPHNYGEYKIEEALYKQGYD